MPTSAICCFYSINLKATSIFDWSSPTLIPSSTMGSDVARWMKDIPNEVPITHLTIPGTHDSHAIEKNIDLPHMIDGLEELVMGQIKAYAVTQYAPIWQQLLWGVRYIDLRVGNPYWHMWHGSVRLTEKMEDILAGVQDFLREHPTETVLISIKWDQDDVAEPADTYPKVKSIWNSYEWFSDSWWPLLKQVRGKAILLRRFSVPGNDQSGIDCTAFYGWEQRLDKTDAWWQQDNGTDEVDMDERLIRGLNSLARAKMARPEDKWVFFSGFAGYKRSIGGTPRMFADYTNPKLGDWLDTDGRITPGVQWLGVVVLNFMTSDLCNKIVQKNFTK